jgi:hypothetical protein
MCCFPPFRPSCRYLRPPPRVMQDLAAAETLQMLQAAEDGSLATVKHCLHQSPGTLLCTDSVRLQAAIGRPLQIRRAVTQQQQLLLSTSEPSCKLGVRSCAHCAQVLPWKRATTQTAAAENHHAYPPLVAVPMPSMRQPHLRACSISGTQDSRRCCQVPTSLRPPLVYTAHRRSP